jgi:hypothetical protein
MTIILSGAVRCSFSRTRALCLAITRRNRPKAWEIKSTASEIATPTNAALPLPGCPGTTGTREDESRAKERGFLLRVDKVNSLKKRTAHMGSAGRHR